MNDEPSTWRLCPVGGIHCRFLPLTVGFQRAEKSVYEREKGLARDGVVLPPFYEELLRTHDSRLILQRLDVHVFV